MIKKNSKNTRELINVCKQTLVHVQTLAPMCIILATLYVPPYYYKEPFFYFIYYTLIDRLLL